MLAGLPARSPAPRQWPRRAADSERLVVSASSSGASDVAGCGATGPPSALAGTPAWCWRRRYLGLWRSDGHPDVCRHMRSVSSFNAGRRYGPECRSASRVKQRCPSTIASPLQQMDRVTP